MTLIDKACFERGCACYDFRDRTDTVKVVEYARIDRLERIEKASRDLIKAFNNQLDYDAWDKALDTLETVLKEKS